MILDCRFGPIAKPENLAIDLGAQAGIIEHGLFLGLTQDLIVAGAAGVRHVRRDAPDTIIRAFADTGTA
jgi:ribose 5-phosphate isomerase A